MRKQAVGVWSQIGLKPESASSCERISQTTSTPSRPRHGASPVRRREPDVERSTGGKPLNSLNSKLMNALPTLLRQKLLAQSAHPFSVVIAYDGEAAMQQAKRLCSQLLDQSHHVVDLQCSWCQFDQLPDERFAREAVEVAAGADLIIVASASAGDPPPAIKAWLEKSLAARTNLEPALSALIGSPTGCLPSYSLMYGYLQTAAGGNGVAFFATGFVAPRTASPLTELDKRAAALTPCLQAILNRPIGIPRWGINE